MENFVCCLHGKQYVTYCGECELLLCPDCVGCEDHKKIPFSQMKAEVSSNKGINIEELKNKCTDHIEANKKRLETFEAGVNLDEMALKTLKERIATFSDDSTKDIDAFAKLKEKMSEIRGKAQTKILKERLDEALKKVFGESEAESEKKKMREEQTRVEGRLEKDRFDYNKVYQKVLIMSIIIDL